MTLTVISYRTLGNPLQPGVSLSLREQVWHNAWSTTHVDGGNCAQSHTIHSGNVIPAEAIEVRESKTS